MYSIRLLPLALYYLELGRTFLPLDMRITDHEGDDRPHSLVRDHHTGNLVTRYKVQRKPNNHPLSAVLPGHPRRQYNFLRHGLCMWQAAGPTASSFEGAAKCDVSEILENDSTSAFGMACRRHRITQSVRKIGFCLLLLQKYATPPLGLSKPRRVAIEGVSRNYLQKGAYTAFEVVAPTVPSIYGPVRNLGPLRNIIDGGRM